MGDSSWHDDNWWRSEDERGTCSWHDSSWTSRCLADAFVDTIFSSTGGMLRRTTHPDNFVFDRTNIAENQTSRLAPQSAGQPGNIRVASSGLKAYLSATIFRDINMLHVDLQRRKDFQELNLDQENIDQEQEDILLNYLGHTKDAYGSESDVRHRSGDPCLPDPEGGFGFWSSHQGLQQEAVPPTLKERPRCCATDTCLVCGATMPIMYFSQLHQQEPGCCVDQDNMDIYLDGHAQLLSVQQGQHFFIEPTNICNDYEKHPCIVLPVYSDKPAMVSPGYAVYSTKIAWRKHTHTHTHYWECTTGQNIIRLDHTIPRRHLRSKDCGFTMDGLTKQRKTVVVPQAGAEGNTFEDQSHSKRIRGRFPFQKELWFGYTDFVFPESAR